MHVAVLCATHRGYRFLERLTELAPDDRFTVFSFREKPWERPFLDEIRALAQARGAEFHEGRRVGHARHAAVWNGAPVDLMFAVSWRYMIPRQVYGRAARGAYVLHDSLLPANRGCSPTVWSVVRGEAMTGATLFEMAEQVDAGDVVDRQPVPIGDDETIGEVMEHVTDADLQILQRNLGALREGTARATPQNHDLATFTDPFRPEHARIDWNWPTRRIYDLIRGYTTPYPGAFTFLDGRRLTLLSASRTTGRGVIAQRMPGRVEEVRDDGSAIVQTGDGLLAIRRVRPEGAPLLPGARLGAQMISVAAAG